MNIVDEWNAPHAPGSFGHLFTQEAQDARDKELSELFASGKGIVAISDDTPDVVLLSVIRHALSASNGRPFTVISSGESASPNSAPGRWKLQMRLADLLAICFGLLALYAAIALATTETGPLWLSLSCGAVGIVANIVGIMGTLGRIISK